MGEAHGTDHSTAGLSAERIGRNDAIFRQANERISEFAEAQRAEESTPFICECADPTCQDVVFIPLAEYAAIREGPRLFWNVPGHEASSQGWAQVIETQESYVVVKKIGPAGEVAEQLEGSADPESEAVEIESRFRRDEPQDDPV
ncbi:MAG TPA: hypothetical protein VFJ93_09040 [Gaiellaceae bacterium]|nr:hypothetical protein [Gaiellaceae bacterium]